MRSSACGTDLWESVPGTAHLPHLAAAIRVPKHARSRFQRPGAHWIVVSDVPSGLVSVLAERAMRLGARATTTQY
eukprot:2263913-Rhodomonas_salina.3